MRILNKPITKIKDTWGKIPDTIRISLTVFGIALPVWIITVVIIKRFLGKGTFGEGLLIEAFGMILDILVIVIVIQWFNEKKEKARKIEQWKEEIDDYRGWDEKEATYRIVGMIRRLNKENVTRIDLSFCFLKGANLLVANLEWANLKYAKLEGADLWDANLEGAELGHTNLKGADLSFANLEGANLLAANLKGVKNLTIEQLSKVVTLIDVQGLDLELKKQIKEKYPHLLEKPKEEKKDKGKANGGQDT